MTEHYQLQKRDFEKVCVAAGAGEEKIAFSHGYELQETKCSGGGTDLLTLFGLLPGVSGKLLILFVVVVEMLVLV
jgi:hypothetical protein